MRYLFFCLACFPAVPMAQAIPDNFDQEKFEQRFRAADKNGDGRLSREEAYAAFPRAPEFFTEIDVNNDGYITLTEVGQARARRVDAVVNASRLGVGAKYVKPEYLKTDQALAGSEAEATDLSSAIAQKRSNEFQEFLEGQNSADDLGIPVPAKTPPNLFNKSF